MVAPVIANYNSGDPFHSHSSCSDAAYAAHGYHEKQSGSLCSWKSFRSPALSIEAGQLAADYLKPTQRGVRKFPSYVRAVMTKRRIYVTLLAARRITVASNKPVDLCRVFLGHPTRSTNPLVDFPAKRDNMRLRLGDCACHRSIANTVIKIATEIESGIGMKTGQSNPETSRSRKKLSDRAL